MGSFAQGALIEQRTTTSNTGGTTTLTVSSTTYQRFTGTLAQTVVLPLAPTLLIGRYFVIENESNASITVELQDTTFLTYIASGTQRRLDLYNNATNNGDWVPSPQFDVIGPLTLRATRPTASSILHITSNQVYGTEGNLNSTSPIDDLINVFPDTTIAFNTGTATGGITGGTVYTLGGTFTRPSVTSGQYVRLVFVYVSATNNLNTKFSSSSLTRSGLTNPGTLYAAIDGLPIGYIDLISTGSFNFSSATSAISSIENKDIVRFSAGAGIGGAGDKSFKFQSVTSNILTIKAGYIILNDGKELYIPSDFTIDLTIIASIDGTYYGYIDLTTLSSSTAVNGRVVYQITASNFYFSTVTPEFIVTLQRFVPIGLVQRISGTWLNQQTTALRRHDEILFGVDSSLEYSQAYTTIGTVGTTNQMQAGHIFDINSFPATISSPNISWYGLISANDSSANARNFIINGGAVFTDTDIVGVADCFAPDGINDYLNTTNSFFAPNAATSFAFGLWIKADNYSSASTQVLVSNWAAGNISYNLQLNNGVLQFVTSSNGSSVTATTFICNATLLSGWNQIVVSYAASGTTFSFYLNGQFLLSSSLAIFTSSTVDFELAAAAGLYWYAGSMDEFFFISGSSLTQDFVTKLYSTKIVHNRNLISTNQRWSGLITYGGIQSELPSFTVDIMPNVLYANFSNLTPTAQIALKLFNTGTLGISKPIKARTLALTASQLDALMPITHYLNDVPYLVLQVDETGTGQFVRHNDGSYFYSTATQILSSGTTLSSIVGASTNVRFTYSVGGESINSRLLGRYIIAGVQPDADFPDLWSALAASSTVAGSRILVVSNQTLTTTTTISNTGVYVEFLPGVQIVSTVAAGTALTISSNLITYDMTLNLQGNANGISFTGSYSQHNNISIVVGGTVTNAVSFAAAATENRINGTIQITGALTTVVSDSSTAQSNVWSLTTGSQVANEFGTKIGSMRTTNGYARISSPTQTPRAAGTDTLDCSIQHIYYKTGGTGTITFSNMVEGQTINLILAATGSAYTITWSPTVVWGPVGKPIPTVTASTYDFYTFIKVGGIIFGGVILSMALAV